MIRYEVMKVLFLDIDGVMNSGRHFRDTHDERLEMAKERNLSKEELMFRHKMGKLDRVSIGYLNKIVEGTGCKIVISSTWRKFTPIDEIREMLSIKGFKYSEFIIGVTEDFNLSGSRGYEVHNWMNEFEGEIESFVILDDDGDMWHLLPWHVRTDGEDGLNEASCELCIKLLNNGREELTGWESVYRYFDCKDYGIFA